MNSDEYLRLGKIDREHWFYKGKRAIVRHWIDRFIHLGSDDLLIDAGMGTGVWLEEMSSHCRVLGLDDHDESLAMARPRLEAIGGQAIKTDLLTVPLPDGSAAVVTLMDVLEHLDDDQAALQEMVRLTRPGGLVVITVPALPLLWSDWDVALHHRRRYLRADLVHLVKTPGVRLLHCVYFNTAMLLPIAAVRAWRRFITPIQGACRAEDRIPPEPLNSLLYYLMVGPACLKRFQPEVGVSLLAVLQRLPLPASSRCASIAA